MKGKLAPVPWQLQILLAFQGQCQEQQRRSLCKGLNSGGLSQVFLILFLILPLLEIPGHHETWKGKDICLCEFQRATRILDLHVGSRHIR